MAEVNAFSIDGTKYQLTATDQTYVGETGLAQLGLDYACTPDELNEALADAGGGVAILGGGDIEGDGWDLPHANGTVRLTSLGDTSLYRGVLEWLGPTSRDGSAMRMTVYDSNNSHSFDGAGWCMTVYGSGDTWSPGVGYDCAGRFGSSSGGCFYFTVLLPAIAPGVSSVSVTDAGTCYVRDASGNVATVSSTSKFSSTATSTGIETTHVRFYVSGLSGYTAYSVGTICLSSGFTIKFS